MHETSRTALRKIFAESRRLLSPGGIMAHADGVDPDDLFQKYYAEWMTHFTNAPFLGSVQNEDLLGICVGAGFDAQTCPKGRAPLWHPDDDPEILPQSSYLVASARVSAN